MFSLFISVRLAERSKAIGLSPMTFECVGSNPAPNINKFYDTCRKFTDQLRFTELLPAVKEWLT